jgi:hypothetical protein
MKIMGKLAEAEVGRILYGQGKKLPLRLIKKKNDLLWKTSS